MSSYLLPDSESNFESNRTTTQHGLEKQPFIFETDFRGHMEMYSPPEVVSDYLEQHHQWFRECAQPMQAEAMGDNGYTVTIGRFASFGYEVEPKMSVIFEVSQEQKYLMYSVEVPDNQSLGYEVQYQASMELNKIDKEISSAISSDYPKKVVATLPSEVTLVKWCLNLRVGVYFPKFIYRLPLAVIQATGDRLLTQIVRQVSPRLTLKVQKDFHERLNLPIPPKSSRYLEKISV
ncbi:DUF1997 domain-containing protein [Gloeocapsa sp. PCC 73106]|uniref:DUF1997 domain-containing protein n=1 Tax=Gloeocapsa sp. PCC 73106 TaxID=102232 RepID=UPI0003107C85|nr:DUF1997 domain-containing protein [Gloeocapsa sp. PCC 73106]